MRTSRKLTQAMFSLLVLVMMSVAALAADPGVPFPPTSEVNDQKAGSILFFNVYTSGAASGNTQNTRINITNTSSTSAAFVHLFFVSRDCAVADSYICFTANQTASFLASDVDPGITGYLVAVATDFNGCPTSHNFLIGDEYVKFASGHAANLGAEAFAKVTPGPLACGSSESEAVVNFGTDYNKAPRVLAASSILSRADGNDTLVIINRVGGWLSTGAFTTGTLFGLLYDDAESAYSFSITGACQVQNFLSDSFPRTTPRFTTIVSSGRTGWFKIYNNANDFGLLGAIINFNPNAGSQPGAFNGGRNLHKLTLTNGSALYTIPVFPPTC